jgi:hypothetical protein
MIPKEQTAEYIAAISAAIHTVATKQGVELGGNDVSDFLVCALASLIGGKYATPSYQIGLLTDYITRVLIKDESTSSETSSD